MSTVVTGTILCDEPKCKAKISNVEMIVDSLREFVPVVLPKGWQKVNNFDYWSYFCPQHTTTRN